MGENAEKAGGLWFPVFHVPHDGGRFPPELMESVCIPEEAFLRYHGAMRDTDISLAVPEEYRNGETCFAFPVSRLLCDVERFTGPEEVMERYGMGFCYEKAYDGTVIKRVSGETRRRTLRYYREHHARMDRVCEEHPRVLVVDLHSYHDAIVPGDFLREGARLPDLCVGADERYTPDWLPEAAVRRFREAGFSVAVNYPYTGCFVPDTVWSGSSAAECAGIMLEFHRRTYCGRDGRAEPARLGMIRDVIRQMIREAACGNVSCRAT